MRTSGRLLTTIALIALLLAPAVPVVAEPVAGESWRDVVQQAQSWMMRMLAPILSQPVRDSHDPETSEEDVPRVDWTKVPTSESLQSLTGQNEVFPGMDPDG